MALSQKAVDRQKQVIRWVIEQVDSRAWRELPRGGDSRRPIDGEVMRRRVYMIGQQALVEPNLQNAHILDSDNNWKIFLREMKLDSRVFYTTADMSHGAWGLIAYDEDPLNNRPSMLERFYKCRIQNYGQDNEVWTPELVDDFPSFAGIPVENVWRRFCIGGKIDDLSSDSSLSRLSVNLFQGVQNHTTTRPGVLEYSLSVSGSNLVGRVVTLTGDPTHRSARIVPSRRLALVVGANLFTVKCIAEDDTESFYTLVVNVRE